MTDQPNPADRSSDLESRIAELERRTRSVVQEGRSGLEEAFWAMTHTLFPEEARGHLKKAGKEQLLAARVYLDKWIARLEEKEAEASGRPHEKIEIE